MNYFTTYEIECPCCGLIIDNEDTERHLDMLNIARAIADIPFIVNSWTRCEKHNELVSGSPTSSHKKGIATDVRYKDSSDLFTMVNALVQAGFERILIYPKSMFIHVDSDEEKARPIMKIMEQ